MRPVVREWVHRAVRSVVIYGLASILAWPLIDAVLRMAGAAVAIGHFSDFGTYYTVADRTASCFTDGRGFLAWDCAAMYNEALSRGLLEELPTGSYPMPYVYPPLFAVAAVPLHWLPYSLTAVAFGVVAIVTLWWALLYLLSVLEYDLQPWHRLGLLAALVGFQPVLYAFKQGQITAFLAASFALAAASNELARSVDGDGRGHRLCSGAFTALPALVKPIYAPAGAHLLRDRWKLTGAAITGALFYGLGLFFAGVRTHLDYLGTLSRGKGWGLEMLPLTRWHGGWFEPLGLAGELSIVLRIGLLLGVIVVSRWRLGEVGVDRTIFALGLAVIPIAAPEAYTLEFIIVLPAIVLLAHEELARPRGRLLALGAAVVLFHYQAYSARFVGAAPEWIRGVYPALQPGIWASCIVIGLAVVRAYQRSAEASE